jgi:hypothetical protein
VREKHHAAAPASVRVGAREKGGEKARPSPMPEAKAVALPKETVARREPAGRKREFPEGIGSPGQVVT